MASEKNLTAVFTDIANAIREKKGTTEQIKPINMADEIANLSQTTAESGTIKSLLDATRRCSYLFLGYSGTNIDRLISYTDTSNVIDMSNMFNNCSSITTIPQLDTSKVTIMQNMFSSCSKLIDIPELNTSNVTNMYGMFMDCSSLVTIPQFDTSNVTSMSAMFSGCSSLVTIPQLNTSNVRNMDTTFSDCISLTSIPQLDTSKVEGMFRTFRSCSNLTTIPQINVSKVTGMNSIFSGCSSLKTILMYGMKVNFDISASTKFEESDLVTILNNLATVTSTKTLTMGATNLAKLTDEEKAIATNKGWTLK